MPFQGRVKISRRTTLALKFVELFLKGGSLFAHFLCVGTHAKRPLSRVKLKIIPTPSAPKVLPQKHWSEGGILAFGAIFASFGVKFLSFGVISLSFSAVAKNAQMRNRNRPLV